MDSSPRKECGQTANRSQQVDNYTSYLYEDFLHGGLARVDFFDTSTLHSVLGAWRLYSKF
jgi:hypothetical protein